MKPSYFAVATVCACAVSCFGAPKKAELVSPKVFEGDLPALSSTYNKAAFADYSAGKLKEAYNALINSKYYSLVDKFGKDWPLDLKMFFADNTELRNEFVSTLCDDDNTEQVFAILAKIYNAFPEKFAKYPRLAVAIAVVFDTPPPNEWPHAQVSDKILPRKFPEPEKAFETIVGLREKGRFLFATEKLSVRELKFVVAALSDENDIKWVQQKISTTLANIPKLYPSITYDKKRLDNKQFDWTYGNYKLSTIKEFGGICTDQAYYTSEVAKRKGVPAFILSGAGTDGGHAWVAYMKAPGNWNFNVGRYEDSRFVTGTTYDPQTWKKASDHDLGAMCEGFYNLEKYRNNMVCTAFAKEYLATEDYVQAEKCAFAAVKFDDRNAETWNILIKSYKARKAADNDIIKLYAQAMKGFTAKYPDIDAAFRRELMQYLIDLERFDDARRLSTSIIIKTRQARPDIAMSFARMELESAIAEDSADKLNSSYKRLLGVFKNDGLIAFSNLSIPIFNALLKKQKFDECLGLLEISRKVLKPQKESLLETEIDSVKSQIEGFKIKHNG